MPPSHLPHTKDQNPIGLSPFPVIVTTRIFTYVGWGIPNLNFHLELLLGKRANPSYIMLWVMHKSFQVMRCMKINHQVTSFCFKLFVGVGVSLHHGPFVPSRPKGQLFHSSEIHRSHCGKQWSLNTVFSTPRWFLCFWCFMVEILQIWMFPKIGGKPPKWMVYNGKPY